jgi:hypothetical protein
MGFADLRRKYESLSGASPAVAREVAQRLNGIVRSQILAGTDPFGNAWPPLKKGGKTPLRKFAKTVKTKVKRNIVAVIVGDWRATFHHEGTAKVPVRQILPNGVMPETWRQAIGEEFRATLLEKMR